MSEHTAGRRKRRLPPPTSTHRAEIIVPSKVDAAGPPRSANREALRAHLGRLRATRRGAMPREPSSRDGSAIAIAVRGPKPPERPTKAVRVRESAAPGAAAVEAPRSPERGRRFGAGPAASGANSVEASTGTETRRVLLRPPSAKLMSAGGDELAAAHCTDHAS